MTEDTPSSAIARRLALLEESGQIGLRVRSLADRIVADVQRRYSVEFADDDAAFFVTHLALALGRVERGDPEPELPAVMEAQVAGFPDELRAAEELLAPCVEAFGRPAPRVEILYVALYLASLGEH